MAKRMVYDAMLLAVALIIFVVEAQIPPLVPIAGVKLGLANIITVYSMFRVGAGDTLAILACRVIIGSIYCGQPVSFIYSAAGGIMCYLVMLLRKRILTEKQIWVCGVFGAIAHGGGQTAVAVVMFGSAALSYLPLLTLSGIITGLFTGLCAQYVSNRSKYFEK